MATVTRAAARAVRARGYGGGNLDGARVLDAALAGAGDGAPCSNRLALAVPGGGGDARPRRSC
jgi:hypothetical protein